MDLERKLETANHKVNEACITQLHVIKDGSPSWSISRDEVVIMDEIGCGASGLVSRGHFRGQEVAVKQIHEGILTEGHVLDEFKREVRIMATIQHPNLIRFV